MYIRSGDYATPLLFFNPLVTLFESMFWGIEEENRCIFAHYLLPEKYGYNAIYLLQIRFIADYQAVAIDECFWRMYLVVATEIGPCIVSVWVLFSGFYAI